MYTHSVLSAQSVTFSFPVTPFQRLEWNAALQERNEQESLGFRKRGTEAGQCICKRFEELLLKAGRLKDEDRLEEASLMCQKALCLGGWGLCQLCQEAGLAGSLMPKKQESAAIRT